MWYAGSVSQAVQVCREKAGLLCVFIQDANAASDALQSLLTELGTGFREYDQVIFLRILSGSSDFEMLNSVYPVAAVPMLQFIDGANGKLVRSLDLSQTHENVARDAEDVIKAWRNERNAPVADVPDPDPPQAAIDELNDRVARAREVVAEIRRKKEEGEKEAEKEKEAQRRRDGQLMAQAERERAVNLAEQTRVELEKERKQDEAHRKKVLQQLKEDREEYTRRQQPTTASTTVAAKLPETASSTSTIDYTKSRIQFRHETVDGMRNFVGTFEATDPLQLAIDLVRKETGLKGKFTLLQMYPRKDFNDKDAKTTLRLLGLVPNAVLMIVPQGGTPTGVSGSGGGMLNTIMSSLWTIVNIPLQGFNYLLRMFFPNRQLPPPGNNSRQGSVAGDNARRPNANTTRDSVRQRRPDPDPTYNGNSTQQL